MELGREFGRNWLKGIALFDRQITANRVRLVLRIFLLIMVEVTVVERRHDHVMTGTRRLDGAPGPVHDRGILRQPTLTDFAPADQPATIGVYKFFDAPDEVTL